MTEHLNHHVAEPLEQLTECSDTVSFMPTDIKVMSSIQPESYEKMIDNRFINYVAIRLRCGVVAMCRTSVLTMCPSVLQSLNRDLLQCLEIFPSSVHSLIKRTRIWVNHSYSYGPHDNPRLLQHTTAHHHHAWLMWARDRPDKVNSIEIYDCREYQRMRWHWNGPGLILHELCHLIHQHCCDDGLRNLKVLQAYTIAKNTGLYDNTLRRDWAGLDTECDLAYAMVDHKEFFAEMSVTYLSDGYHHLDEGDKSCMDQCSPPFMEPAVVERIRQKKLQLTLPDAKINVAGIPQRQLTDSNRSVDKVKDSCPLRMLRFLFRFCKPKKQVASIEPLPHCNKFYPFTRGQLKHHDTETYRIISELWRDIEFWDDPDDDRHCGRGFALSVPFLTKSKFRSDLV